MTSSPKLRRRLQQILPFGLLWLCFSIIFSLIEKGILGDAQYYPSTGNVYDFEQNILLNLFISLPTGLVLGTIEILWLKNLFKKRSLGQKIIFKTLFYSAFIILFLLFFTVITNSIQLQTNIFDPLLWETIWTFFSNLAFWSIQIYIASILLIALFYSEVSDHLGIKVLHNFFRGKYHQPIEEERIFMFCDMKSSTTIAEKIGHVKFFELLKEYYDDISDATVEYAGEIYQYVGDEIIVSWKLKDGIQNNNCVECFFAMRNALQKQSEKYQQRYDWVPSFKAGYHFGKVTTGEIGAIRKEIMFTGDVLNTTARIQGLCNQYEVDLIISEKLKLRLSQDPSFEFKSLGENELRGRDKKIKLFTVSR